MEEAVTQTPDTHESPSMSAMLNRAQGRAQSAPESPAVEPTPEAAPEAPEVTPAPAEAPPATPAPTEPEKIAAEIQPAKETKGVLSALQSERQKRQAIEAENAQLKAQLAQSQVALTTPVEPSADGGMLDAAQALQQAKLFNIATSERLARHTHSDFDEKYKAFETAAASDQALLQRVLSSDDPGEWAYREGSRILMETQYGADVLRDPVKFREAILKEAELKKPAATKSTPTPSPTKQPTDISAARAGSGAPAEYQSPDFGQMLQRAAKKRRG